MKRIYLLVLFCAGAFGFVFSSEPGFDNSLTSAEKKEGWVLLFDGRSTRGWRMFNGGKVVDWTVKDGALTGLGKGGDIGGDIVTRKEYKDFIVCWDWKVGAEGNSGFMYRVQEGKQYKAPYETGPEYQMIDDQMKSLVLEAWQKTACDYAMYLPNEKKRLNAPGTWNSSKIVADGSHIEYWLNGEKVVEFEAWTPDWNDRKKNGKWSTYPDYGKFRSGKISLQDHGSLIYFKNIKVKKIKD